MKSAPLANSRNRPTCDASFGVSASDPEEELEPLLVAMAACTGRLFCRGHFEGGKQSGGDVALVVMVKLVEHMAGLATGMQVGELKANEVVEVNKLAFFGSN
jgi:hypothetical protein